MDTPGFTLEANIAFSKNQVQAVLFITFVQADVQQISWGLGQPKQLSSHLALMLQNCFHYNPLFSHIYRFLKDPLLGIMFFVLSCWGILKFK